MRRLKAKNEPPVVRRASAPVIIPNSGTDETKTFTIPTLILVTTFETVPLPLPERLFLLAETWIGSPSLHSPRLNVEAYLPAPFVVTEWVVLLQVTKTVALDTAWLLCVVS